MDVKKAIETLLANGYKKYTIKKELGVAWNTVNQWSKGYVRDPLPGNISGLARLLKTPVEQITKKGREK